MESLAYFLHSLHSPEGIMNLIRSGGLLLISAIVFSETGLLVGFFLPGDSLIITAGIFTSSSELTGQPLFSLSSMLICLSFAAVIGDQSGYFLGSRLGVWVQHQKNSWFIKKKHLRDAHEFYEKHGDRAIILAHFVPIFRTFVPFTAGAAKMSYRRFARVNVIGALLWVWSMTLAGHYLGQTPWAKKLHQIILIVIFVSILPMIYSITKAWINKRKAA